MMEPHFLTGSVDLGGTRRNCAGARRTAILVQQNARLSAENSARNRQRSSLL